jgi:hypothetical protein
MSSRKSTRKSAESSSRSCGSAIRNIIAGVILVLAAVGGWRGYDWYIAKQAAENGSAFEDAVALSGRGEHADAEGAFAKLANEGTPGYRVLARLRQAAELADREPKSAIAAYERIAGDNSIGPVLQDLAGLRAGALLIDQSNFDIARARLEAARFVGRTFRHSARIAGAILCAPTTSQPPSAGLT